MSVLRVFPHCDVHLALDNPATVSVDFRVFFFTGANGPFGLSDTTSSCTAQILAPHNVVGNRLEQFVTVDVNTKTITATKEGTNLVILQTADTYIVIRVQVHKDILAWWFGDAKITTALDTQHAHSQPSIYARFSNSANKGTDATGDITGHGFVTLTSSNNAIFTVDNTNNAGRLQGHSVGNATLNGNFIGANDSMPVQVVDYAQNRNILVPVRVGNLANAANMHNVLFLAEGFTAADQAKFDQIVTQATTELLTKPRHQPYGTLASSLNVFKAFVPSNDRLVTCCFQVNDDQAPGLSKGRPIPYEHSLDEGKYTVAQLVEKVGLPMHGESRNESQLKALWNSQFLDNFDDSKVNERLVEAWKKSTSEGFLESRDGFFGMKLGARWADGSSTQRPALPLPANDSNTAQMRAFIERAYEFYKKDRPARSIDFDPRRHAPESFLSGKESRTSSFMNFLSGLRLAAAPNTALGSSWVPDGSFKPSRGLIAMLMNEHMHGGTNLGDSTVTANCLNTDQGLAATFSGNANIKRLRRDVPADLPTALNSAINTIAHEFGHSFNLGDEYEEFIETPTFANDFLNPGDSIANQFDGFDNIASLETIFNDSNYLTNNSRAIDPSKMKWAVLPRIKLSAKLTAASQMNGANLQVTIDSREAAAWEAARVASDEVQLRRVIIEPDGKQLPLSTSNSNILTGLSISSVNASTGVITLTGGTAATPFPIGSALFIPRKDSGGTIVNLIEPKVMAELNSSHQPLNKDTDTSKTNKDADYPRDIPDFKPPCQSARLIGAFEGGATWTGLVYRPTGTCKMRTSSGGEENGEFCHVCKWLITQRVDPGKHHLIDTNFYPVAKKNE